MEMMALQIWLTFQRGRLLPKVSFPLLVIHNPRMVEFPNKASDQWRAQLYSSICAAHVLERFESVLFRVLRL